MVKLALWRLFTSSCYLHPKHSEVEDSLSLSAKYSVCWYLSGESTELYHGPSSETRGGVFSFFHGIVSCTIAIIFIALWCIVLAIKID